MLCRHWAIAKFIAISMSLVYASKASNADPHPLSSFSTLRDHSRRMPVKLADPSFASGRATLSEFRALRSVSVVRTTFEPASAPIVGPGLPRLFGGARLTSPGWTRPEDVRSSTAIPSALLEKLSGLQTAVENGSPRGGPRTIVPSRACSTRPLGTDRLAVAYRSGHETDTMISTVRRSDAVKRAAAPGRARSKSWYALNGARTPLTPRAP